MKFKLPKFKFVLTRSQNEDGMSIPKYWGFAYRDFDTATVYAYPIPFNKLMGWLRNLWHWLKHPVNPSILDRIYNKGVSFGINLAQDQHKNQVQAGILVYGKDIDAEVDKRIESAMRIQRTLGAVKEKE